MGSSHLLGDLPSLRDREGSGPPKLRTATRLLLRIPVVQLLLHVCLHWVEGGREREGKREEGKERREREGRRAEAKNEGGGSRKEKQGVMEQDWYKNKNS